jgi:hypothetical protein
MVDRFVEAKEDPMRQTHSVSPSAVSWLQFWKRLALKMIERRLNFQIEAPISFDQFWQLH